MPKRISKAKHPKDVNQSAHRLVELSTSDQAALPESVPSPSVLASLVMAEMGRKGGLIGGKRRLETMTPTQRKRIAKKAAAARWKKSEKK